MNNRPLSVSRARRSPEQYTLIWQRLLVLAGVLLLSAILAPRASERYLVLLIGVGAAALFLRWPRLGLGCFLWFAREIGRLGWRLRTRAYICKGYRQGLPAVDEATT